MGAGGRVHIHLLADDGKPVIVHGTVFGGHDDFDGRTRPPMLLDGDQKRLVPTLTRYYASAAADGRAHGRRQGHNNTRTRRTHYVTTLRRSNSSSSNTVVTPKSRRPSARGASYRGIDFPAPPPPAQPPPTKPPPPSNASRTARR